jgi:hypothetical protein
MTPEAVSPLFQTVGTHQIHPVQRFNGGLNNIKLSNVKNTPPFRIWKDDSGFLDIFML